MSIECDDRVTRIPRMASSLGAPRERSRLGRPLGSPYWVLSATVHPEPIQLLRLRTSRRVASAHPDHYPRARPSGGHRCEADGQATEVAP